MAESFDEMFPDIKNPEARMYIFWRWLDYKAAVREREKKAAEEAAAAPAPAPAPPAPPADSIAARVKARRQAQRKV